jgi:hypothetical protein
MGYLAEALHTGSFVWADTQSADFASTRVNEFSIRASGGVRVAGGVAVTGASSPYTGAGAGIFMERLGNGGALFAYDYSSPKPETLYLNSPGGNVFIGTTAALADVTTYRLQVAGGVVGDFFYSRSDRNAKENFEPVSPNEILDKVVGLPISTWNYKTAPGFRHIGPMAQDFCAAFGRGTDDKHIANVDADGVALAAIQGLNQKLEGNSQNAAARHAEADTRIRKLEAENEELRTRLAKLEQALFTKLK